jgi:hypothetical protein
MSGNIDIVNILIKAGVDLNIQANMQFNRRTALHFGILLIFIIENISYVFLNQKLFITPRLILLNPLLM